MIKCNENKDTNKAYSSVNQRQMENTNYYVDDQEIWICKVLMLHKMQERR